MTELQMVDGQIVENSGSVSSGSGAAEGSNVTELQLIDGQIVEARALPLPVTAWRKAAT